MYSSHENINGLEFCSFQHRFDFFKNTPVARVTYFYGCVREEVVNSRFLECDYVLGRTHCCPLTGLGWTHEMFDQPLKC